VRGIQFQGIAKELSNKKEITPAMEIYAKRYKTPEKRVEAIMNNTEGHVCYQIKPSLIVLFDERNFPDNPRQEYTL